MVRVGGVIVIGAILTVIGISFLFYSDEVLTDVKVSSFGEPIQVGDIMFDIQYVANFEYLEKTKEFKIAEQAEIDRGLIEASNEKPEYTYFQIQVTAENKGSEIVRLTGGQLHLYDDSNKRYSPTFVGYGDSELSLIDLEPQKAVTLTTQFDIDYDVLCNSLINKKNEIYEYDGVEVNKISYPVELGKLNGFKKKFQIILL